MGTALGRGATNTKTDIVVFLQYILVGKCIFNTTWEEGEQASFLDFNTTQGLHPHSSAAQTRALCLEANRK